MNKFTIKDFRLQYPNDDACLHSLFETHYGNKSCLKCDSTNSYVRVKGRKSYQCTQCSHQVYPMKGTIYQKSRTPLTVWFYALFLFCKSKNGVSALELQRQTGVTYKTAYRMLMHFRASVPQENDRIDGTFEMDETFVGGKNINRHWDKKVEHGQGRSFKDKTPVFGMYCRETGKVRAIVIPNTSKADIQPLIFNNIQRGSHIMSDEWKAYRGIERYYFHEQVDHARKEYSRGNVTTNRIENFWSVLKRTLKGSYISVSRKWLQMYVNETTYRFNNKENNLIFHHWLKASFWTPVLGSSQNLLG